LAVVSLLHSNLKRDNAALALQPFLAHYQKAKGEVPKEPLQYIPDCLFTKKEKENVKMSVFGGLSTALCM
jgi:hypothetical protein